MPDFITEDSKSLAGNIEPEGERALPENYRPALAEDVPEGRACGNCAFYNEEEVQGDKAYCEKWDDYVSGAYYCNAWQPAGEQTPEDAAKYKDDEDEEGAYAADQQRAPINPDEDREIIDMKELETRSLPMGDFAVTEGEDGQKTFSGYAALFNTPSQGMPFTEVIAPDAFTRTLKRTENNKKIISFLFGHDETRALATTASGRLNLTQDARGLKVEAKLDPADPDAASVISKLTYEARSMGMSFGFSIPKNGDVWEENVRTLKEINLFEVSVLSAGQTPAYPSTIGLTAVRKVSADKLGVDGDQLMSTIESIKSAQPLTQEDVQVLDQVRERLAPKPVGVDPSVALALLTTKKLMEEVL